MLRRAISVFVAVVVCVLALLAYYFLWIVVFRLEGRRLILSLILLGACIYSFHRGRSLPLLLCLTGAIGLTVAHLYDFFIVFGLAYELFQFGGSDSYILQGFGEPRENPLIAVPADILRCTGVLVIVGIAWLSSRFTFRHLTNRSSQPLAALRQG